MGEERSFRLRAAVAADVDTILALVKELATYEREPDAVVATRDDFLRDGFGERPLFHVLLAEDATTGASLGFAFYFFTYSTWEGRSVLWLEDLFVRSEHRGRGVGAALLRELARVAVERGCPRFQWQVLDWNVDAKAFYERLGAGILHEWETVRIEGAALRGLAMSKASSATPTQIATSATLNVGQWSVTMWPGMYFCASSFIFRIQSAR